MGHLVHEPSLIDNRGVDLDLGQLPRVPTASTEFICIRPSLALLCFLAGILGPTMITAAPPPSLPRRSDSVFVLLR